MRGDAIYLHGCFVIWKVMVADMEELGCEWIRIEFYEKDIWGVCSRYHFEDADFALLEKVYREYLEGREVAAWYAIGYGERGKEKSKEYERRCLLGLDVAVVMTLGRELDDRQNQLMEQGRMVEAYMLECLAVEALNYAYKVLEERFYEKTGLRFGRYRFPGSGYPLEEVAVIVEAMGQQEVGCNEAFALVPKKSVAYVTSLEKVSRTGHLCEDCDRVDCPNRVGGENKAADECVAKCEKVVEKKREKQGENRQMLNYGYQRIFRRKNEKEDEKWEKD